MQKRYIDNGDTKFSTSFGLSELPQAIECGRLAMQHLMRTEAEIVGSDDGEPPTS